MKRASPEVESELLVAVQAGPVTLEGNLTIPPHAQGIVLFAHGSGSSRHSPRNRFVASQLHAAGLGTLLVDLLTEDEEAIDRHTGQFRFDVPLLAERLVGATDWLDEEGHTAHRAVGYFGASTGAAAALLAAAQRVERIAAVVSRGGRPDLAGEALPQVRAATLFLVGGLDGPVIPLNEEALARLGAPVKQLVLIPGASHLFEERGKLEEVAHHAARWFTRYLARPAQENG